MFTICDNEEPQLKSLTFFQVEVKILLIHFAENTLVYYPYLERVDAVTAVHTVFNPALVTEARAISGELLRRNLKDKFTVCNHFTLFKVMLHIC